MVKPIIKLVLLIVVSIVIGPLFSIIGFTLWYDKNNNIGFPILIIGLSFLLFGLFGLLWLIKYDKKGAKKTYLGRIVYETPKNNKHHLILARITFYSLFIIVTAVIFYQATHLERDSEIPTYQQILVPPLFIGVLYIFILAAVMHNLHSSFRIYENGISSSAPPLTPYNKLEDKFEHISYKEIKYFHIHRIELKRRYQIIIFQNPSIIIGDKDIRVHHYFYSDEFGEILIKYLRENGVHEKIEDPFEDQDDNPEMLKRNKELHFKLSRFFIYLSIFFMIISIVFFIIFNNSISKFFFAILLIISTIQFIYYLQKYRKEKRDNQW